MKVLSLLSTAALTTCLTASGFCGEENPERMDFRESPTEMTITHDTSNSYNNQNSDRSSFDDRNSKDHGKGGGRTVQSVHGCVEQGFSIEAEFLWWRANLDNLEYALRLTGSPTGTVPNVTAGDFKFPNFEFDPGVRVSVGYDFGRSNWDVFLRWTYHYTDPTDSTRAPETGGGLQPLKEFVAPQGQQVLTLAQRASVEWQNQFNVADLEMGYDYFFSRRFSFRPSFGLKAAWINMHYHARYTDIIGGDDADFDFVRYRNKSEFWGIGPQVGMDGHLHIGWGFSLFGRVSGALLYGAYDTRITQLDSDGNATRIENNSEYRQRAMNQILIGLEWAKCFSNGMLLALNIGWEGQYWWNQNEMRFLTDFQPYGDLTFTGLDVGIRFDF